MLIWILSRNVRGLGRVEKRRMLKEMVWKSRVEIVMVQESKLEVAYRRVVAEICGFMRTKWIFSHPWGLRVG